MNPQFETFSCTVYFLFQALLVDPSIPFGALPNSMADTQLATSTELDIQKVYYLSNHLYPQSPNDNITLEKRIQEVAEGKYRLIGDSYTLEYFAKRHCLVVTGEFSSQQYALVLRRGTVYTNYLNDRLVDLANQGVVKTLIEK